MNSITLTKIYEDHENNLIANVSINSKDDPGVRFIRFCINSNKTYQDTKTVAIDLQVGETVNIEKLDMFLQCILNENTDDNDVIFVLMVRGGKKCLLKSNSKFIPYPLKSSVEGIDDTDYYIYDHACIDVDELIPEIQEKLEISGQKWR